MGSLNWLFNSTRQPGIDVDKVSKYPGNSYIIAMRRGHIFKIMLEDGRALSYLTLKRKFEAVLEHSTEKTSCKIKSSPTFRCRVSIQSHQF